MSTEQQAWGAAQNAPQKWSTRKTVAAVAIAVAVAGAGGAAIYAASGTDASASQGGMGQGGMGQGGPGGQGQGGGQSALLNALHGEYVVSDSNGGYTTELMQIGTVTEISSTSLTAKSTDGYTKTYTIDSSTAVGNNANISSIASGDTVTVVAKVSGTSATVETVTEESRNSSTGQTSGQG